MSKNSRSKPGRPPATAIAVLLYCGSRRIFPDSSLYTVRIVNKTLFLLTLPLWIFLSACEVQNSPHAKGEESSNTLFTSFGGRSPKYLDPTSSYSTDETPLTYQIYEPLFSYHYLKRPYELIPRAAATIPLPRYFDRNGKLLPDDAAGELIAESVYDIPIKKGILFQPHPAFARSADGKYAYHALQPGDIAEKRSIADFALSGTREMTADDYVYAIKRLAGTRVVSPIFAQLSGYIVGLKEYGALIKEQDRQLRQGSAAGKRDLPFLDFRNYPLAGAVALDPHLLRIRVKGKYPQFKYWLAMTFMAPIPWEADLFYSQPGMAANNLTLNFWPVGTGPYMLTEYRQNRRHVLQRNPNFRGEPYPCEGEPGDRALGLLDDCGKMTPFIDRIVFTIEKEAIPHKIKFFQGYYDIPEAQRGEYGLGYLIEMADSKEKNIEYREKKIRLPLTVETSNSYIGFNMLDPVVGDTGSLEQRAKKRKLRQAISIAIEWEQHISIFEKGQAMLAHGPIPPGLFGYREGIDGINTVVYDVVDGKAQRKSVAVARQLLAEAGYPDGRDAVTGRPLVINYDYGAAMTPETRPVLDWYTQQFDKLGIQLEIRATDYNRFQDKMRRGAQQLFSWGWVADYPDPENFLFLFYGPHSKVKVDGENAANYANPAFDTLFEKMKFLDDGPEKARLIARMVDLVREDAPWSFGYFPMSSGVYHQWVGNGKPTQMIRNPLQYLKIDPRLRAQKQAEWNRPVWWPLLLIGILLALAVWPAYVAWKRREQATAGIFTQSKLQPAQGK